MSAQLHLPAASNPLPSTSLKPDRTSELIAPFLEACSSAEEITYGLLKKIQGDIFTEELLAKGKSLQRVDNCMTAVNGWMRQYGFTDESPIGPEFGERFNASLDKHIETLQSEGKTKQTIDDRRSLLGICRDTWVHLLQSLPCASEESDFATSLGTLIKSSGMFISQVAGKVGISTATLTRWVDGEVRPSKNSIPMLHRLEEFFHLPCCTLIAKLPRFLHGSKGQITTGLTGFRKHFQEVIKVRYFLAVITLQLRKEFDNILQFYTSAAWLKLHRMKRNSKWRVREHDGRCPTAERVFNQIRGYLGYLCLPLSEDNPLQGGKGYLPEQMTLALLSDSDLVYDFLQFKKERTYLKQYNTDTKTFLTFCLGILRPETGFLWQSPELGERLPTPVKAAEWHGWCERHRAVISETRHELVKEDEFKKTRDPFDAVRSIIVNNQHPLDVLHNLADDYEADKPLRSASEINKASHFQRLFLIKFATLIPLRAFNFSVMTFRADNTGNLYQRPDGSWWIRFPPSYFKNHHGKAKKEKFDVPLHKSLWSYVEEFLLVHRLHLLGAGECDYVFRPWKFQEGVNITGPMKPSYLSRMIYVVTQRYIPNCPGFGLHAFRHLVATEYIKNNPGGYEVAAAILHDNEETVRKNYTWVVPSDKIVFWNDYVDTQHERLRSNVDEVVSEGVR